MSLLQEENHMPDAELIACELSGKFLNNAMLVMSDCNTSSVRNSKEILAALIVSQAISFNGQCYTNALITELECIKEKFGVLGDMMALKGSVHTPKEYIKQVTISALSSVDSVLNNWSSGITSGSFKINPQTAAWSETALDVYGDDLVSLIAYLEGLTQFEGAKRLGAFLGIHYQEPDSCSGRCSHA